MPTPRKPGANPTFRLLGHAGGEFPSIPKASILEAFPNRSPNRDYWVTFDCQEFTSMCPVTGQPDFATIRILYVPEALCIETKSLKYYLASYRSMRSFNEEIINQILDDLVRVCSPRQMVVRGEFSARGGIQISVDARYPSPRPGSTDPPR